MKLFVLLFFFFHHLSASTSLVTTIFTSEENNYLLKKQKITMCIDPNWMPFEQFDQNGKHVGLSAEYFKIFQTYIPVPIEPVFVTSWPQSLQLAQERKCDIMSLVMQTPQRKEFLNFTTPYLNIPLVVTSRMDLPFVNDIVDLKKLKVAIPKGYAFAELLKNKYSYLQIVEVADIDDGLTKVTTKEVDVYIGTLASVGYKLQSSYIGELKIAGKLDQSWQLGIGVRNDDPILLSIFQKAVNTVTLEQKQQILNKWISVKFERGINYDLLFKVVAGFLFVLGIILYFFNKQRILSKKLQVQKDEFETIFKASKDGIALLDLQSNFVEFNDEYLKMTGFARDELLTKSCIGLTAPNDIEKSKQIVADVISKGYIQNFEKTSIVKDNNEIIVNMSLALMPDKKRILISVKDVTHLKKMESQAKLAAMGEMIANIAHQWRQPLSVISTAATGMQYSKEAGILTDESFYDLCENINENAQYLSKTIDDFRNFIKGDSKPVYFTIEQTLESFDKLMHSSIKKHNIHMIIDQKTSPLDILGYPSELIQCYINIFNNAKDALALNHIEPKYFFIDIEKNNDTVYMSFKDNAGGIPAEVIEKVFEPYFTTKHQYHGTGLGLHMSYNIITSRFGGKIEVKNEEFSYANKSFTGAKFVIALPVK